MSETEIDLARSYLSAAEQDPVAALIRSVREVARLRRLLASTAEIELELIRGRRRAALAAALPSP